MSGKTRAIILGSVALTAIGVLSIFLALTTTAAPTAAAAGLVTTDPTVVSPNNAISTGSRAITITVMDPDLNRPAFIGSGPNGEAATFDQVPDPDNVGLGTPAAGDGERIEVNVNTIGASFVVALTANPVTVVGPGSVIGTDIFTPLADRDGDGDVDPADIEIVIPVGSNVVAGDISVASIFGSTSRGVVVFQVLRGGLQGQFFDVRYATSTRELTRATKSYTETLSIPSGGVVDGQTFTLTLNIDNLPLQDANGDAVLSSADITVTVPGRGAADTPRITGLGGTAILANQANGLASGDTITLVHTGSALSAGTQINVAYLGLEDLLTVKGAPADTVPLRLRETGADTGVYQATIIASNGSFGEPNSPNGHLDPTLDPTNIATADANGVALGNTKGFALISVIDNGFVTVTYKDRSPVTTITARVRVEDDGPVFSNVSPADGATTGNTNELLVAGVTDLVAGVDPTTGTSVNVIFGTSIEGIIASGGNLVGSLANIFVTGGGPSSIISETFVSSGVYRISYSIANAPVVAAAVEAGTEISQLGVAWQVSVKDVAGNEARSSARNLIVDTTTPVLQGAFAGDNWDATNNRLASSDPSRKFGADSRTSIRVEFDKAMDGSSFDTGDFLVDGVAPTGVDHFAGSAVNVFLTVAEMAPDATPFIQIVGVVRDDGGNPLSTGSVTADDDMAPRVTLTFDDGRNATTGDIKLRIVSDEALATAIPFYRYQAMCVKHNVYGCHQPHSYRQGRPEPAGVDLRPEGHHHRSAQHARAGHRRT